MPVAQKINREDRNFFTSEPKHLFTDDGRELRIRKWDYHTELDDVISVEVEAIVAQKEEENRSEIYVCKGCGGLILRHRAENRSDFIPNSDGTSYTHIVPAGSYGQKEVCGRTVPKP